MKKIYIILSVIVIFVWLVQIFDIVEFNKVEKILAFVLTTAWLVFGAAFIKKKPATAN